MNYKHGHLINLGCLNMLWLFIRTRFLLIIPQFNLTKDQQQHLIKIHGISKVINLFINDFNDEPISNTLKLNKYNDQSTSVSFGIFVGEISHNLKGKQLFPVIIAIFSYNHH